MVDRRGNGGWREPIFTDLHSAIIHLAAAAGIHWKVDADDLWTPNAMQPHIRPLFLHTSNHPPPPPLFPRLLSPSSPALILTVDVGM